jgi:hypothetical protein
MTKEEQPREPQAGEAGGAQTQRIELKKKLLAKIGPIGVIVSKRTGTLTPEDIQVVNIQPQASRPPIMIVLDGDATDIQFGDTDPTDPLQRV